MLIFFKRVKSPYEITWGKCDGNKIYMKTRRKKSERKKRFKVK